METNNETSETSDPIEPLPVASSVPGVDPQTITIPEKKTLKGFPKIWVIFWSIGNLAAGCAPANRLGDSNLGGFVALFMLIAFVVAAGYIFLYYKKPFGLLMILIANILGILMNLIEVSGYTVQVSTGLIMGIITYFITRKQVPYSFGKPAQ